ncbi:hypothetical protein BCD67_20900 [Oscillatoriales cyanobacterium USR001]|nr:hypothetical protein BCD67_20900 [Oscillatoriales cyanobacterium USR001]
MSFVGIKQLSSASDLRALLAQKADQNSYYFLRWFHKVNGIVKDLPPEFPSPEGQMFNPECELRWKQNKNGYEVLLLSQADLDLDLDFTPVGKSWETQLRDAEVYSNPETRFPNPFKNECPDIAQRYFIDKQTCNVHFVALTVNLKKR